jgi:parvulin-like peptidyl-prolyl isomerase
VATINGFHVTSAYVDRVIEDRFAREVLESIVRSRVIEDEARARRITVSDQAVAAELARRQKEAGSPQAFTEFLQRNGLTLRAVQQQIREQLLLDALMDKATAITDADARAYYDAHPSEFSQEPELHILDIAAATQQDALAAYRALLDGTPFEVVARRFQSLPIGKDGDLGWVSKSSSPIKGLWEYAETLKQDEAGIPYELEGRFHIVKVVGRRAGGAASFEAVKDKIKELLRQRKGLSEEDYITSLIARADIKVNWPAVSYLEKEYQLLKGFRVSVDGRTLRLDPPPFIGAEGVLLVPAKPVLQAVGASVQWRPGAKILEITRDKTVIKIALGEKTANVNGELRDMKAAAILKDGVLFIPPRTVLGALGLDVSFNNTIKLVAIRTPTH